MGRSDKQVIFILTIGIIGYLAVWIAGATRHKAGLYLTVMNVMSSIALLVFGLQQELRVSKHFIEGYEIAFYFFKILVATSAVYYLVSRQRLSWLKSFHFIFFSLHSIAAILFLAFMLTFRINKLF